ncbi:MAG: ATP-binding cassette domain-containing protein [Bacteroidales bacterium]|nr:ATP-binding cassette domain-containing protein [Bacteroidales bacterium]
MEKILEIKGLRGGYVPQLEILQGIDMTLERGDIVGIIGLNGCGKSTLGKAIMNMIPIREGEIFYKGEDVAGLSTTMLARKGISIMQQGGQVFTTMSVWDNLQLAFGKSPDSAYMAELKKIVPLLALPESELKRKMADKLSGGQRHQLALAMALASKPDMVILDEPSAGLSPRAVVEMYGILEQLHSKFSLTILLIEQNIAKALDFCYRSYLLAQGSITQDFKDDEIKEVERIMFNKR